MMGERQVQQDALFYEFSLERHVPVDHLLRAIDRFIDLGDLRVRLASFYSSTGRPSIDPELLIRMLLVGYCYGIRWAPVQRAAGSAGERNFGVTSVAAPKAASSSAARYSSIARLAISAGNPLNLQHPFAGWHQP